MSNESAINPGRTPTKSTDDSGNLVGLKESVLIGVKNSEGLSEDVIVASGGLLSCCSSCLEER